MMASLTQFIFQNLSANKCMFSSFFFCALRICHFLHEKDHGTPILLSAGTCFVKASCFRSKKKNFLPYTVMVALNISGKTEDGHCDCPAGKVACNHLMGVLRTLALLQSKGFSQAMFTASGSSSIGFART